MSFGNYGNAGNIASMIQPRAKQQKTTQTKVKQAKSLVIPRGLNETSPGNYTDSKGNQVIKQGDKFYTIDTQADSAFGYITVPTEYVPPPPTFAEQVDEKVDAIEAAVGSRTPIFEDLPQPEETPIETSLPEDATPDQIEEAKQKEEAAFRKREQERQARRDQLRSFAGQRRSLLRPAARRPYYG